MRQRELEAELAALPSLDLPALRERWTQHLDKSVPRVSAGLLRLWLAWELQALVHGDLSRGTLDKLDQLSGSASQTDSLRPGTQLVREWNGVVHVVTIYGDGAIAWNGTTWPSLSRVAREIAGTRWSGPAFFGLKQRTSAA